MLATLENALPLTQALREFFPPGRTGNPVHLSTALRWVHHGVLSRSGQRIRLHVIRVGGVHYIRPCDAERFLLALNAGSPALEADADADMQRRGREAGAALERLGA